MDFTTEMGSNRTFDTCDGDLRHTSTGGWASCCILQGVTRRLAGYRGITVGLAACFVALGIAGPALMISSTPARAAFREIDILDDEFEPPEIIVRRGDTVVWIHRGVRPHGVRATDGSFDSSPGCSFQNGESCMRNGERYSRTFDTAGTFNYYCQVHGSANGVGMAGQITVASEGGSGGGTTTTSRPPPTTQTTRATTTVNPPPTGGTTSQSPGDPAPPQPPGSSTAPTPPATGADGQPVPQIPPPTVIAQTEITTTSVLAAPTSLDTDDDGMNMFILVAAAIVLAAALTGTAWYYRPGARPPTEPPGPTSGP